VGAVVVTQGEIWWLEVDVEKARPVLVVTRDEAIPVLRRVVVAPITRTLRATRSQLPVGRAEGLPSDSVCNFDDLTTVPKSLLVRRLGDLGPRHHELGATLRAMAGC
jgi:mRNA interferase MazF